MIDCWKKYEYANEGGLVVNEEARKLIAKYELAKATRGQRDVDMSIKCCHDERCRKYEYLTKKEAIELVARRVLTMASQMWPGVMFITWEDCLVDTVSLDCFVEDETWDWEIKSVLYYYGLERLTGEETQRIINLAKAVEQFFDESKAKVLKLTFKKGTKKIKRRWDEYDVLYVGDVHGYKEYCFEPQMSSDDIVAYVVLTADKVIPVATEEFKEHVW